MNYKEKFLKIFNFLIKNKAYQDPEKLNGKYVSYVGEDRVEEWFKNGILHRDGDKPAVIKTIGKRSTSGGWYASEWYQNGVLHRDNDQPAIIEVNGNKKWYKNGLLHREDGPAVYINHDHDYVETEYYLNGIHYLEENFEDAKKRLKLSNELAQELDIAEPIQKTTIKKLKI